MREYIVHQNDSVLITQTSLSDWYLFGRCGDDDDDSWDCLLPLTELQTLDVSCDIKNMFDPLACKMWK